VSYAPAVIRDTRFMPGAPTEVLLFHPHAPLTSFLVGAPTAICDTRYGAGHVRFLSFERSRI
jgi:hypothetical protein